MSTFGKIGARPLIKPPYDTEIEYLQVGSGSGTLNNLPKILVEVPSTKPYFGMYAKAKISSGNFNPVGLEPKGYVPSGTNPYQDKWLFASNYFCITPYWGLGGQYGLTAKRNGTLEWEVKYNGTAFSIVLKQNGTTVYSNLIYDKTVTLTNTQLRIVCPQWNGGSSGIAQIYSIITYDMETETHNFTPVRRGQTGYMYDKVDSSGGPLGNGLYPNVGSGAFILGPDKVGGGGKCIELSELAFYVYSSDSFWKEAA